MCGAGIRTTIINYSLIEFIKSYQLTTPCEHSPPLHGFRPFKRGMDQSPPLTGTNYHQALTQP